MSIKQFFKSTAFKCIIVLLTIALIAGGLLSISNDIFFVSEKEKLDRVITKLYGSASVEAESVEISEDLKTNVYGTVNSVYKLSDGNMIVNSTGAGGYKGGTVTTWTVTIINNGKVEGIKSISIDSYTKQTLMSQLGKKFTSVYSTDLSEGEYFSTATSGDAITNVVTGATMSSNATNNAVNIAIKFARLYIGEETASSLVNGDNVILENLTVEGTTINYSLTAKSVSSGMPDDYKLDITVTDGALVSITVKKDGSTSGYGSKVYSVNSYIGKTASELKEFQNSSSIKTGATNSNNTIVNALIYATANYEYYLNNPPVISNPLKDAINAIYGEDITFEEKEINELYTANSTAEISELYTLSNGDLLFVYKAGKATVYTAANETGYDAENAVKSYSEDATDEEKSAAVSSTIQYLNYMTGKELVLAYQNHVKDVIVEKDGDTITYTLVALTKRHGVSNGAPNHYKLKIIVKDGKIVSVEDNRTPDEEYTYGPTYGYGEMALPLSRFTGKTEEELLEMFNDGTINTGATKSNTTVINALLYATANYSHYMEAVS